MNAFFALLIVLSLSLVAPKSAHAIVFLPAVLLIPIAKIVAVVIGGASIPSIGLGVFWHTVFGNSLVKIFLAIGLLLLALALATAFFLHLQNPNRPLV